MKSLETSPTASDGQRKTGTSGELVHGQWRLEEGEGQRLRVFKACRSTDCKLQHPKAFKRAPDGVNFGLKKLTIEENFISYKNLTAVPRQNIAKSFATAPFSLKALRCPE